jgi:hypothetical protein
MAGPSAHRARREVSAGCYRLADRLNEPQHWGLLTSLVKEFGLRHRRQAQGVLLRAGKRGGVWLKYKVNKAREVVMGGYYARQSVRRIDEGCGPDG